VAGRPMRARSRKELRRVAIESFFLLQKAKAAPEARQFW
jgi:hypothetical protein